MRSGPGPKHLVRFAPSEAVVLLSTPAEVTEWSRDGGATAEQLAAVARRHEGVRLHELVSGCKMAVGSAPAPRVSTPRTAARLEWLRRRAEEREYERIVSDIRPKPRFSVKRELDEVRADIGLGVHVLALMFTGFFVMFYVASQAYDGLLVPCAAGLAGMLGAMVVETVLHILREEKRAAIDKQKHRR